MGNIINRTVRLCHRISAAQHCCRWILLKFLAWAEACPVHRMRPSGPGKQSKSRRLSSFAGCKAMTADVEFRDQHKRTTRLWTSLPPSAAECIGRYHIGLGARGDERPCTVYPCSGKRRAKRTCPIPKSRPTQVLHRGAAARDWGLALERRVMLAGGSAYTWVVDERLCFRSHHHSSCKHRRAPVLSFVVLLQFLGCDRDSHLLRVTRVYTALVPLHQSLRGCCRARLPTLCLYSAF
jgi:hypothetical protein